MYTILTLSDILYESVYMIIYGAFREIYLYFQTFFDIVFTTFINVFKIKILGHSSVKSAHYNTLSRMSTSCLETRFRIQILMEAFVQNVLCFKMIFPLLKRNFQIKGQKNKSFRKNLYH